MSPPRAGTATPGANAPPSPKGAEGGLRVGVGDSVGAVGRDQLIAEGVLVGRISLNQTRYALRHSARVACKVSAPLALHTCCSQYLPLALLTWQGLS